jgi:anti-anti-sigma regulatory factor
MIELSVDIEKGPESVMLTLAGTLDSRNLEALSEALEEVLHGPRDPVTLNLYECEYLDEAALLRILQFQRELREFVRTLTVYVRPMSFVSHRLRQLPLNPEIPQQLADRGEQRLAEKRMARLRRWRKEKPIRNPHPPGVPQPPQIVAGEESLKPVEVSGPAPGPVPVPDSDPDLVPIDFKHVSVLAGKDERVIKRVWETYSRFLDTGRFKEAPDGLADTQLTLDARMVAQALRLDPNEVRKVIESVSTHLMELLDEEEESSGT